MNILIVGKIHQDALQLLAQHSCTYVEHITEQHDVEAVVLRTYTHIGEKELELLPNLKYIVSCSVGIDNINREAIQQRNVELIHVPGTNANSVAEHTLFLLLSLLRKTAPFPELNGKTVGIIGLGYIGKLVARKLKGFGCTTIAFDVIEQDLALLEELHVTMKLFDDVVAQADILTIHVPLNKHTQNLINENVFEKMKENSFFINTSRAEVIDEAALLRMQHKFRGIALDVGSETTKELQNAIITDHCAAQGEESFRQMCLQPVQEFLNKI